MHHDKTGPVVIVVSWVIFTFEVIIIKFVWIERENSVYNLMSTFILKRQCSR